MKWKTSRRLAIWSTTSKSTCKGSAARRRPAFCRGGGVFLFFGGASRPVGFLYLLFFYLKFLLFPSMRLPLRGTSQAAGTVFLAGALLLSLLCFLKILSFPLRRARAARGPLLSAPAESRQRQAQGSFTPLRIPGPKWGAGRPPLETPKSRCAIRIGRTPRRFAAGASVPLGKAASACALATIAAPPPLRGGGCAPWPPTFPKGESLPVMRACWGLRPLAPCVPQREKSACHARTRMVPRPKRLLRRSLRKSPGSSCRASG